MSVLLLDYTNFNSKEEVSNYFKTKANVKHLSISGCNFNIFLKTLPILYDLEYLNLSNNNIKADDICNLKYFVNLKHLDLSYNKIIGKDFDDFSCLNFLKYLPKLKYLNLSGNFITNNKTKLHIYIKNKLLNTNDNVNIILDSKDSLENNFRIKDFIIKEEINILN